METNQIKQLEHIQNHNNINKKINKFNEDIIILNDNDNPIFLLTIELEEGKNEKLEIFSDSDPDVLAQRFCREHNLDDSTFFYLKDKIQYLVANYNKNNGINNNIINIDMNDINKELKEEENNEQKMEDKNDYFKYYINEENKDVSFQKDKNKVVLSKGIDINNITIKKNSIKNNTNKIYNNVNKNQNCRNNKEYKNINKAYTTYKKSKSYMNSNYKNNNNNQINKINNYFNIQNKNINNDNNKINTYYNYYKSKYMNKIKIQNKNTHSSFSKNNIKTKSNREQKIKNQKSFNNNNNEESNQKMKRLRKKTPVFRSILSKNESIGKNLSNYETYSSSKINTDTYITNHTTSRIILDGIKFDKDNVIINNKRIKNYGQYLYERNKIRKKEKQNEICAIERKGDLLQYKQYSFKPKTNIKNNNKIKSKYKNSKNNLILYEEQYNFKPTINHNYKTDLNFNQRQILFNNIYKRRNELLKQCFKNPKLDEKGNELFKPKLISKQNFNSNSKSSDIFDKNYAYYKKYNYNKKQLFQKYNRIKHINACPKEKTDKILNDVYNKIFMKLFNDLDSDQDDLITSVSINLSNIPSFILKTLKPILKELKEDEQTLNSEEFILVMLRLFEDTPLLERQNLINYYKKKIKEEHNDIKLKRAQTPNQYKNIYFNNIINSESLTNISSNSFYLNNKNEKMALKYDQKILNDIQKINDYDNSSKYFDDFNCKCLNLKGNENNRKEMNDELCPISKYTFNNYIKQVKN